MNYSGFPIFSQDGCNIFPLLQKPTKILSKIENRLYDRLWSWKTVIWVVGNICCILYNSSSLLPQDGLEVMVWETMILSNLWAGPYWSWVQKISAARVQGVIVYQKTTAMSIEVWSRVLTSIYVSVLAWVHAVFKCLASRTHHTHTVGVSTCSDQLDWEPPNHRAYRIHKDLASVMGNN